MKKKTLEEVENQQFEAGPRHYAARFHHEHSHPHPHATLLSGVMIGVLSTIILISVYVYNMFYKQTAIDNVDQSWMNTVRENIKVSPIPTIHLSKWGTYTSTNFNISFKYPGSYTVNDNVGRLTIGPNNFQPIITIITKSNTSDFNSLKLCSEVYKEIEKNPLIEKPLCLEKDPEKITLDGFEGRSFYITNTGRGGTSYVLQINSNPPLEISVPVDNEQPELEQFNQFVSTIRFTQ